MNLLKVELNFRYIDFKSKILTLLEFLAGSNTPILLLLRVSGELLMLQTGSLWLLQLYREFNNVNSPNYLVSLQVF